MTPESIAADLEEALASLLPEGWVLIAVHPPTTLSADRTFLVELADRAGRSASEHFPASLVVAYFGDEEGAVDHLESWLAGLS